MLGEANNAPSLHRYLYAFQNPTVYVDPEGMEALKAATDFVEEKTQDFNQSLAYIERVRKANEGTATDYTLRGVGLVVGGLGKFGMMTAAGVAGVADFVADTQVSGLGAIAEATGLDSALPDAARAQVSASRQSIQMTFENVGGALQTAKEFYTHDAQLGQRLSFAGKIIGEEAQDFGSRVAAGDVTALADGGNLAIQLAFAGSGLMRAGTATTGAKAAQATTTVSTAGKTAQAAQRASRISDAVGGAPARGRGLTKLASDARRYVRDIESQTGRKVGPAQRSELADALRTERFEKLSPEAARKHRADFDRGRDKLISEWEERTGQEWPRYTEDVLDSKGKPYRHAGDRYDAHHIIESSHGGPNKWWNIHPAASPTQHQGGIHRAGGVARELFR